MALLTIEAQADEMTGTGDEAKGWSDGSDAVVRISNDAAENGYEQEAGPLTWLNSARITVDQDEDAVHCLVSVGDPRGAFCMTVRRCSDGQIVIHLPHPGESMAHMPTKELHPGTLVIVSDHSGEPVSFADPEPDSDADDAEVQP